MYFPHVEFSIIDFTYCKQQSLNYLPVCNLYIVFISDRKVKSGNFKPTWSVTNSTDFTLEEFINQLPPFRDSFKQDTSVYFY